MANYCDYEMRIVGEKENVNKLISYLKADYRYTGDNWKLEKCTADKHFFRVFEANHDEDYDEIKENGLFEAFVYGDCAWSVESCMFDAEYGYIGDKLYGTYYFDCKNDGRVNNEDFRGTHMVEATKDLNLTVEIYSREPGACFMEHFIVDKGNIITQENCKWYEVYDEEEDTYVSVGGYEVEYSI